MFLPRRHSHKGIGSPEPRLFLVLRKRFGKGGGGGSAPPAVDPARVAEAQAQANIATANRQSELNNVRTTSPFGKSFFEEDPEGRWNLSQTLDPQLQPVFNNATSLAQLLSGTAADVAPYAAAPTRAGSQLITDAYNTWQGQIPTGPINTDGLPGLQYRADVPPGVSDSIDYSNLPQRAINVNGAPIQSRLDFSGLTDLPTSGTDFSNLVHQAQDAAYGTQARYLDPQYSQKRGDLRQQLADEGIPVGSEAYTRATGDLDRAENFAYGGARDAATLAGNEEQGRLFGENLSSRQQGVGERQSQGEFYNRAQQLGFGQSATNAQLLNAAQEQLAQMREKQAGYQAGVQQQLFGQNAANSQLNNQARQQGINELITKWAQPLTALGQQAGVGQGILGSTVGNLSGLQPFSDFGFSGNIPTFGSQGTVVPATNVVGAQNSANNAAAARFAAQNTQSNQLFNGIGSLGGALGFGNGGLGSSIGSLFGGGAGGSGIFDSTGGFLGSSLNSIPFETLDAAAGAGGIGGGGEALGFLGSLFSDRRLKEDIEKVGELDNDLPIYRYRYKGDPTPRIGLMADEVAKVRPEAVHATPSGFMAVNYGEAVK